MPLIAQTNIQVQSTINQNRNENFQLLVEGEHLEYIFESMNFIWINRNSNVETKSIFNRLNRQTDQSNFDQTECCCWWRDYVRNRCTYKRQTYMYAGNERKAKGDKIRVLYDKCYNLNSICFAKISDLGLLDSWCIDGTYVQYFGKYGRRVVLLSRCDAVIMPLNNNGIKSSAFNSWTWGAQCHVMNVSLIKKNMAGSKGEENPINTRLRISEKPKRLNVT